jgi:hypothetical protein
MTRKVWTVLWAVLVLSVFPLGLLFWGMGWVSMRTVAAASLTMGVASLAVSWWRDGDASYLRRRWRR